MGSPRRDALAVGLATGAYGLSFGAVSVTAGLSVAQTAALSLLMFTGGSQFAFVGVVGAGGGSAAAVSTAALLGSRNLFYSVRLATLLRVRGLRRLFAAHLVIDESTAMGIGRDDAVEGREAFWATGLAVFVFWNLATIIGALSTTALADPKVLGLDAAAPAAFVALLAPRMRGKQAWVLAVTAAILALAATPVVPSGVPVLLAAAVAIGVGLRQPVEQP